MHRDLKPENVFLVRDNEVAGGERVKLLDFGIAKLTGDEQATSKTQTGAIMGTPLYMSPEQCRGAGEVDHRSDIYALGCMLYHLLVGRPPFVGEGLGEILAMQLYETATPPSVVLPFLGGALDVLVMRCLAKSPGERFADMNEVAAEIGRHLASPSVLTPPGSCIATSSPRTCSWSRRASPAMPSRCSTSAWRNSARRGDPTTASRQPWADPIS